MRERRAEEEKSLIKKLYSKIHDSYKYYVFYEYDNKHIPLKLIFLDVAGCYYTFTGDKNIMNFILDDDLLE